MSTPLHWPAATTTRLFSAQTGTLLKKRLAPITDLREDALHGVVVDFYITFRRDGSVDLPFVQPVKEFIVKGRDDRTAEIRDYLGLSAAQKPRAAELIALGNTVTMEWGGPYRDVLKRIGPNAISIVTAYLFRDAVFMFTDNLANFLKYEETDAQRAVDTSVQFLIEANDSNQARIDAIGRLSAYDDVLQSLKPIKIPDVDNYEGATQEAVPLNPPPSSAVTSFPVKRGFW